MNGIGLLLRVLLCAGALVLEFFLSRTESKWPGLILPAVSLLYAILFPLNTFLPPDAGAGFIIMEMLTEFLFASVPMWILLAVYFACRAGRRRKKQLEKMNIQDLS